MAGKRGKHARRALHKVKNLVSYLCCCSGLDIVSLPVGNLSEHPADCRESSHRWLVTDGALQTSLRYLMHLEDSNASPARPHHTLLHLMLLENTNLDASPLMFPTYSGVKCDTTCRSELHEATEDNLNVLVASETTEDKATEENVLQASRAIRINKRLNFTSHVHEIQERARTSVNGYVELVTTPIGSELETNDNALNVFMLSSVIRVSTAFPFHHDLGTIDNVADFAFRMDHELLIGSMLSQVTSFPTTLGREQYTIMQLLPTNCGIAISFLISDVRGWQRSDQTLFGRAFRSAIDQMYEASFDEYEANQIARPASWITFSEHYSFIYFDGQNFFLINITSLAYFDGHNYSLFNMMVFEVIGCNQFLESSMFVGPWESNVDFLQLVLPGYDKELEHSWLPLGLPAPMSIAVYSSDRMYACTAFHDGATGIFISDALRELYQITPCAYAPSSQRRNQYLPELLFNYLDLEDINVSGAAAYDRLPTTNKFNGLQKRLIDCVFPHAVNLLMSSGADAELSRETLPATISSATYFRDEMLVYSGLCNGSVGVHDSDTILLYRIAPPFSYISSSPRLQFNTKRNQIRARSVGYVDPGLSSAASTRRGQEYDDSAPSIGHVSVHSLETDRRCIYNFDTNSIAGLKACEPLNANRDSYIIVGTIPIHAQWPGIAQIDDRKDERKEINSSLEENEDGKHADQPAEKNTQPLDSYIMVGTIQLQIPWPHVARNVDNRNNGDEEPTKDQPLKKQMTLLTRAHREHLRFHNVQRKKDFICVARIKRKIVNILEGVELHSRVFSAAEQKRIVDCVYDLQERGRKGELREHTYFEFKKCKVGKSSRVTIQFGCCSNFIKDNNGNPPGILRNGYVDPIPPFFKTMIKRLVGWHVIPPSCVPDSCVVTISEPGDSTPPHIDSDDFLRPFCTVSLLSDCVMKFGSNIRLRWPGDFSSSSDIPLHVGSVLVFNGNGADVAEHSIPFVDTKRYMSLYTLY